MIGTTGISTTGIGTDVISTAVTRTELLLVAAAQVCPTAPPGAQAHVNTIMGYVLWGVLALFSVGVIIGVGAIVAGRIFSMPHASKAGVVSIVMVFVAAIAYLVLPAMVDTFTGTGCVTTAGLVVPLA